MAKLFTSESFQVRGYELDSYGHVNNSVYLNYAEYARWCMIEKATSGSSYFQEKKLNPALAHVEIDYKKPCYLAEWLHVETKLLEFKKVSATFEQKIIKEKTKEVAAVLKIKLICTDPTGKLERLPSDFNSVFG